MAKDIGLFDAVWSPPGMEAAAWRRPGPVDACNEEATGGSHRSAAAAGPDEPTKADSPVKAAK